jgi:hypothetical protein
MIVWTKDYPHANYSSHTGRDEYGNVYHERGWGEAVTCTLPDGRKGSGWTAGEAFRN